MRVQQCSDVSITEPVDREFASQKDLGQLSVRDRQRMEAPETPPRGDYGSTGRIGKLSRE